MGEVGTGAIGLSEVQGRIDRHADVSEEEVAALLLGDRPEREIALRALLRTRLRQASDLAGSLAKLQSYAAQETLDLIERLAPLAGDELARIAAHKAIGLTRVREGNFEEAMLYLHGAVSRAGIFARRSDPRASGARRYVSDPEIDRGFAELAQMVPAPASVPLSGPTKRLAFCVSGLLDDNAPALVAFVAAEGLRRLGYDVNFVSSEYGDSRESKTLARVRGRGFAVALIPRSGTFRARIDALSETFAEHPVDGAIYVTSHDDAVAKVASHVGLAPAQFFVNIRHEPHCGRFDYVFQTLSPAQERLTSWPGKSVYLGAFVARGPAIDGARPLARSRLGIPANAVALATFGRLHKCSAAYLAAVERILTALPRAVLILAGPAEQSEADALRALLRTRGIDDRVRVLGPRQDDVPELLRTVDVYLDSFPDPGGQSLLEAMYAGLPVVAMRLRTDEGSGAPGATAWATAEELMPPDSELAAADDGADYVRIAVNYGRDAGRRRTDGGVLSRYAHAHYSIDALLARMNGYLRRVLYR